MICSDGKSLRWQHCFPKGGFGHSLHQQACLFSPSRGGSTRDVPCDSQSHGQPRVPAVQRNVEDVEGSDVAVPEK